MIGSLYKAARLTDPQKNASSILVQRGRNGTEASQYFDWPCSVGRRRTSAVVAARDQPRLLVLATCRVCGAAKVLALAVNSIPVREQLISVPQMGLSMGSGGHGLKAPRNLSGTRVCSQ